MYVQTLDKLSSQVPKSRSLNSKKSMSIIAIFYIYN